MRYVGNGFSANMVDGDFLLKFESISEEEFMENAMQAHSVIGHEDIADELGLEFNREQIKLVDGDVLFLVTPLYRPKLEGEVYRFVPRSEGWVYRKVTVEKC